ncbi:MAG: TIGR03364 family FAD-dependent oxidoreductase [Cyclobacteriaceae bacterium]|nr:TIGR03364 family FAD-dependent oxidoreductase [Cyclobacteriaceae bacterium]
MKSNHYDLIVIGAGVLGTFHAYHAAVANKKILLLEKDQQPMQATVRNFGQVVPSGMSNDWFQFGVYATQLYKTIQADYNIGIRQNGSVYIASDDDEQQLLHELKQRMDARGYEAHILTTQQCLSRWPVLHPEYCREGLFFPQEVSAEPNVLIHYLLKYCTQRFSNLTYQNYTTIQACEVLNNQVKVVSSAGQSFTAHKVIICNGSEFKILFADIFEKSGIVISKLQMLRTQPMPALPLEGNILTGLTTRRYESFEECPSFSKIKTPAHLQELKNWGIHILFKKAMDGSVIVGDSHEYVEVGKEEPGYEINQHINNLMWQEAARIVDMKEWKLSAAWAGYYSQHPQKDIVEIDIENRIHIRTAIGGKGMTSSAGYAQKSVQQILRD